jgi:hypothetical protein
MGLEAKDGVASVERAHVSEELFGKYVGEELDVPMCADRVQWRERRAAGNSAEYALDCAAPAEDRAEDTVAGTALGSGVHLVTVFLVGKDNSEELRF